MSLRSQAGNLSLNSKLPASDYIRFVFSGRGWLVILRIAVSSELHNKDRDRSDQDDVNVASFMQKKSQQEPNYRQSHADNPHSLTSQGPRGFYSLGSFVQFVAHTTNGEHVARVLRIVLEFLP